MIDSSASSTKTIAPGSTIGMLGSGQLGKMTAMAAKYMGYRVHIFSPDCDTPAGQVADVETQADYLDSAAVETFAKDVDVVTLEFENVPIETLAAAGKYTPVHPGIKTLETTQHRVREKMFLRDAGILTCRFEVVRTLEELQSATQNLMPSIVKTTSMGYDGKGQFVLREPGDVEKAWETLQTDEAIVEEFIDYDYEFSIVASRSSTGQFAAYPTIRNEHENQILDLSFSPSGLSDRLNLRATEIVAKIMEQLDTVGVLCVEFFCCGEEILVNEIAPRPHNSGHLTIEAHATSQFEQQVRAICGLPLGSTHQIAPAAMANLLGQQWEHGRPNWERALSMPNVKLHLYCKQAAKTNRKMGHMVALADSSAAASAQILEARKMLHQHANSTG